jgi:uncharacterized membrane protein YdbT with pleckstrin-like domain
MSYVDNNLISGEKVLYKTGLHWVVLLGPAVVGGFFGLTGLALLIGSMREKNDSARELAAAGSFLMVVAAACIFAGIIRRKGTEMAVTNKRVIIKTGLLRRRTFELLLSKVESIGVEEGLMSRMFGYGSVVVRGTGGTPEPFANVGHPLEFRRQVQQQIEASDQKQNSFKGELINA